MEIAHLQNTLLIHFEISSNGTKSFSNVNFHAASTLAHKQNARAVKLICEMTENTFKSVLCMHGFVCVSTL
jgi:hypothetical protein